MEWQWWVILAIGVITLGSVISKLIGSYQNKKQKGL